MEVWENSAEHRYEAIVEGQLAGFTEYRIRSGRHWFVHTEIDAAFEQMGVGSSLVKGAMDDMRSRNLLIVPTCPFVAAWLDRHEEYQDLIDAETLHDYRRRRRGTERQDPSTSVSKAT